MEQPPGVPPSFEGWAPGLDFECRYVLRLVSEEERRGLDQRALEDQEFFDRVCEAENELIDAYTRGVLPDAIRRAVDEHLLSGPDRAARLAVSRRLAQGARFRYPVLPAIAAACLVLAVVGWLKLRPPRAPQETSKQTTPTAAAEIIAMVSLPAGVTRGDAEPIFPIASNATVVEFRYPVNPAEASGLFAVELRRLDGQVVRRFSGLTAPLSFRIPVALLQPGEYECLVERYPQPDKPELIADLTFSIKK
jgi:hypothetical protein